jgi:hypothetical protein
MRLRKIWLALTVVFVGSADYSLFDELLAEGAGG